LIGGLQKLPDYWEAWDVNNGEVTPVDDAGVNDKFITCNMNTYASKVLKKDIKTCGRVLIKGQAIAIDKKLKYGKGSLWHEGEPVPDGFDPCDPKNLRQRPWGILDYAVKKPPEWTTVGPRKGTYHELIVRWNCCGANVCQLPTGCTDLKVGNKTKPGCTIIKGIDLPKK
jgi:hypothetical protein